MSCESVIGAKANETEQMLNDIREALGGTPCDKYKKIKPALLALVKVLRRLAPGVPACGIAADVIEFLMQIADEACS